jgi:hypothetical protein
VASARLLARGGDIGMVIKEYDDVDPAEAVASLVGEVDVEYVRVRIEYPLIGDSLTEIGFQTLLAEYGTFMVKALTPGMTASDAIHLLGIGSERFMISTMDTT